MGSFDLGMGSYQILKGPQSRDFPRSYRDPPTHQRIAKGAGGKGPRQKTSNIVKKCQRVFRHFSTIFAQGRKRQKSSKNVEKFFDTFRQFSRGTVFPAPFGGPSHPDLPLWHQPS